MFAGFSVDSVRDRIQDGSAVMVITADEGRRAGKTFKLKDIVDEAVRDCPTVKVRLISFYLFLLKLASIRNY